MILLHLFLRIIIQLNLHKKLQTLMLSLRAYAYSRASCSVWFDNLTNGTGKQSSRFFMFSPNKKFQLILLSCLRRVLRGRRSLLVCPRLTGLRVAPPAPRRHVHPSPSAGNPLWRQSDANRRPELHALINCNAQVEQANSLVFS